MKTNIAVVAGLTLLLTATFGLAQQNLDNVRAMIPHEFTAVGKVLPAGQYSFIYNSGQRVVIVKNANKGESVIVPVVTWLAKEMHTTPNDAHVVFDKIGNRYYLSELWIPELYGLDLLTTKEKHEHEVVNVPR